MEKLLAAGQLENGVLRMLPEPELIALLPDLERVTLGSADLVCEAGKKFSYVYFPESCILSFIGRTEDGATVEVSSIGREGITPMRIVVGADRAPHDWVCIVAGDSLRIKLERFKVLFDEHALLRDWTLRCAWSELVMLEQMAVCNRHHPTAMRLARWLLFADDRVENHEILITQELLSKIVGAHRPAVTTAVGILQRNGAIGLQWGRIVILEREKLEDLSCECYAAVMTNVPPASLLKSPSRNEQTRSPRDAGSATAG